MKIDEAIYILKKLGNNSYMWASETRAIETVINERECLLDEVARMARESVEREKELTRLEGDILAWKLYHTYHTKD